MSAVTQSALQWIDRRDPPPPFELHRRLQRALERADAAAADSIPDALAEAAFDCLRSAVRLGDDRAAANDLLAADALLTYACEAAAETGVDELDVFLQRLEVARFEALTPGVQL